MFAPSWSLLVYIVFVTQGKREAQPGGYYGELITTCPVVNFQATDADHGAELWKTDGTGAGTTLVKDIFPGEKSGSPTTLTPFEDYLYFQVGEMETITGCKSR